MNTITLTDEQYQALQNGESITIAPPKTTVLWEPKEYNYCIVDYYISASYFDRAPKGAASSGLTYKTKTKGDTAAKTLRSYARLLSWLSENDDGWEPNWNDDSQQKFYLRKDHNKALEPNSRYYVENNNSLQSVAVVYMSQQNANKLCKLLNNGIVIL